ncbi:protease modulator HflC [candidate division KSB1 bacterium]|nr:protease modulator HflC [candidate division KSB1 bacterium]
MKNQRILIGALLFVILIVLANGFYTVSETEQVVVTQFGRPVGGPVMSAGLHWKTPFIQNLNIFDKRILSWDGDPNQIPTKDKRYIWVDVTARWKIVDPLIFLQSVRNESGAQGKLDDIVDAATRDYVSNNVLLELVRNSNRPFSVVDVELNQDSSNVMDKISLGRGAITQQILADAQPSMIQFGIELVDVMIKRINYVEDVRKKVYERMISERKRIAERYRSEGQGQMAEIDGKRERELQRIQSEAYMTAQQIRGQADAEATRIYADAYNLDADFYEFLKTLDTYKTTIDENTSLILSTKSAYFKYFKGTR